MNEESIRFDAIDEQRRPIIEFYLFLHKKVRREYKLFVARMTAAILMSLFYELFKDPKISACTNKNVSLKSPILVSRI